MKIWQKYGLNKDEYDAILEQMGREPNELELALFGVMWSEHCCYKHTRHLLKELPTQGPIVVQGPGENAGVIDAGDGLGVAFKLESHNHPSAVEPFLGAATGVGGIVRDVVSMGARPFALINSLRLGTPDSEHNRWLLRGIVSGMADYGNCLEVPTVAGEIYFDSCYDYNPLVNAMCIGLVPLQNLTKGTAAGPGNRVLAAGARTGREGIAGAAFASAELAEETSPDISEMQPGDPQAGKKLMEACLELAGHPDVVGIQDMGAAGLTSSSCEMAFRGGCGIEMELSLVPTKEEGITPVDLLLSESQERMLVIVKPSGVKAVQEVFQRHGLEAADIGEVTGGKDLVLLWEGREVGRIPAASLADGVPRRNPSKRAPEPAPVNDSWKHLPQPEYDKALLNLLASPNISSRASLWSQFDYLAGGNTVQGPGTSAGVLRLPGSKKGIAAAVDCNSTYCFLNPREGTKRAVAEAARNVACTGAKPAAVTNCLNFPSPEVPEQYWALAESIEGMAEACRALGTPVVSGNVSLYNEGGGVAINPTPVISMVGLVEDVEKTCTIAPQKGQTLVLLGKIQPLPGGSEYLRQRAGSSTGAAPAVDLELEAALCRLLPAAINQGLIKAAHDVSEGGIAVTLAEMALAGGLGIEVSAPGEERPDFWLFSESPGAVVAAVEEEQLAALKALAAKEGILVSLLGSVSGDAFVIKDLIQLPLTRLEEVWAGILPEVFLGE
ncbi:MAG: phosphoribosylformylglycinamidine synthase subunit PurL [Eubacteriales bacterium]|nr:phosphoribosylformylglycinamidine synthase subunit PurL [Eubacteriales bacterium]